MWSALGRQSFNIVLLGLPLIHVRTKLLKLLVLMPLTGGLKSTNCALAPAHLLHSSLIEVFLYHSSHGTQREKLSNPEIAHYDSPYLDNIHHFHLLLQSAPEYTQ